METFKKIKVLGKGGFGTAELCLDRKTGDHVVAKRIKVTSGGWRDGLKEAKNLSRLLNPNIVTYIESFYDRVAREFVVIQEYCSGGDLHDLIQRQRARKRLFREQRVLQIIAQVACGLSHCHKHHILHRDLKPRNIFITGKGCYKIGDFGLSKKLDSTQALARTACGTLNYLSPEICRDKMHNTKTDIWSLGCVMFECLTLKTPFSQSGKSMNSVVNLILYGRPGGLPLIDPRHYRRDVNVLLTSMLRKMPTARPTIDSILRTGPMMRTIESAVAAAAKAKAAARETKCRETKHDRATPKRRQKSPLPPPPPPPPSEPTTVERNPPQLRPTRPAAAAREKGDTQTKKKKKESIAQETKEKMPKKMQQQQAKKKLKTQKPEMTERKAVKEKPAAEEKGAAMPTTTTEARAAELSLLRALERAYENRQAAMKLHDEKIQSLLRRLRKLRVEEKA